MGDFPEKIYLDKDEAWYESPESALASMHEEPIVDRSAVLHEYIYKRTVRYTIGISEEEEL